MRESGVVCSGTLDEIEITEELARMKAQKHTFSYYDADDIKQEIWISVNKSAKKFKPSRTKKGKRPLSFFNVATENALKNLKRDNRIIDNVNLGDTPVKQPDFNLAGELRARELYEFILNRLPHNLLEPFEVLVNYGGESLSSYLKSKIRAAVAAILEGYYE